LLNSTLQNIRKRHIGRRWAFYVTAYFIIRI